MLVETAVVVMGKSQQADWKQQGSEENFLKLITKSCHGPLSEGTSQKLPTPSTREGTWFTVVLFGIFHEEH